jgi:hypothetical protein
MEVMYTNIIEFGTLMKVLAYADYPTIVHVHEIYSQLCR